MDSKQIDQIRAGVDNRPLYSPGIWEVDVIYKLVRQRRQDNATDSTAFLIADAVNEKGWKKPYVAAGAYVAFLAGPDVFREYMTLINF